MASAPYIWVQSFFFQIEPGEDELTNPGIYGRALANWLAEKLQSRGEPVQEVLSEDWGWCVMLTRKPYRLWIGCANRDKNLRGQSPLNQTWLLLHCGYQASKGVSLVELPGERGRACRHTHQTALDLSRIG